jgi:Tfp pilus assembly protein PilF
MTAHADMAARLYAQGDFAQAAQIFEALHQAEPSRADHLCNLATALLALGKGDAAAERLLAANAAGDPLIAATLGMVLKMKGQPILALPWLKRALMLDPQRTPARINLANALSELGRYGEAAQACRDGLAQDPGSVALLNNLGLALTEAGEPEAALAPLARAMELAPGEAEAAINRAHALLLMGNYKEGFLAYEARRLRTGLKFADSGRPWWDGSPLQGRTLLVHAEQGLGDAIQFVRFLGQIEGRLALSCDRSLLRLFKPMASCVTADDAPPPAHDVQALLLSLPGLLGVTASGLPGTIPYLQAEAMRLPPSSGLKVGLVWAGSPGHRNDRNRSLAPGLLAPLQHVTGATFYSLQKGRGPAPGGLIDLAPQLDDLADTARALAALDLVIAADTSVLHLAGALGRPAWGLIPFAPDWRWGLGRETSPWYPSLRLFRQERPGDWPFVIERVRNQLSAALEAGGLGTDAPARRGT